MITIFTEEQNFKQWWIWVVLLTIDAVFLFGVFIQLILKKPFGNNPMSDTGLLIITGFLLLLTLMFFRIKLNTAITRQGIYVQLFPFHIKPKYYLWSDISKAYIRQYNPLGEFGGWGIRINFNGKGKAYNTSGDIGLQLEFKNGNRILIGTQKAEEMREILRSVDAFETGYSD